MDARAELQSLRRLAELEAKAGGVRALHEGRLARAEQELADHKPPVGPTIGGVAKDTLAGAGELALTLGSGLLSIPVAAASAIPSAIGVMRGEGLNEVADRGRRWAAAPVYQPRTEAGQGAVDMVAAPFRAIDEKVGEDVSSGKTSPAAGAFAVAAPQMLLAMMGSKPAAEATAAVGRSVGAVGKVAGKVVAAPINAFRPSKVGDKFLRKVSGTPEQRPATLDPLRQTRTLGPDDANYTAAQALADTPEGTVIQGLQQTLSRSHDKGISVDFSKRFADQLQAIENYKARVNLDMTPARELVKQRVDAVGGLEAAPLLAAADDLARTPVATGTPVASAAVTAFHKILKDSIDKNGRVSFDALYQFRRTGLDEVLRKATDMDPSALSRAKIGIAKDIQSVIDKAIAGEGGPAWKQYLAEYSEKMKPVNAMEESTAKMYSPPQKTDISTADAIGSGSAAPQFLSRPTTSLNYGLGLRRRFMESSVNRHIANRLLDPKSLADVLAEGSIRKSGKGVVPHPTDWRPMTGKVSMDWPDEPIAPAGASHPGAPRQRPLGLPSPQTVSKPTDLAEAVAQAENRAAMNHPGFAITELQQAIPELSLVDNAFARPGPSLLEIALEKVMAASPRFSATTKGATTRANKLPGRTKGPYTPYEDRALRLTPEDATPAAQSAKAAQARGKKLEDALLGRKRK